VFWLSLKKDPKVSKGKPAAKLIDSVYLISHKMLSKYEEFWIEGNVDTAQPRKLQLGLSTAVSATLSFMAV